MNQLTHLLSYLLPPNGGLVSRLKSIIAFLQHVLFVISNIYVKQFHSTVVILHYILFNLIGDTVL